MLRPPITIAPVDNAVGPSLRVTGEIEISTAPLLRDAILRYSLDHDGPIALDMARVEFIDSTGLSALVATQNALAQQGKGIELHHVPTSVARIIELVGLTEHLRVRQPETLTD